MDDDDFGSSKGEDGHSEAEAGQRKISSLTLEAAEAVVRRSRRELQTPPGTRPADARSSLARINKALQESDLSDWAQRYSYLLPAEDFSNNWRSQGSVSGQECDVYYDERSGCYLKRNNTIAYEDWIQFFESVRIHNYLFVDTAYTFLGLMEVDGLLHAVLSQKGVSSTIGASRVEVMGYMARFGFRHVGNDHYESESLLIQDLHEENVLVGADGLLYFIDTCIYLKEGKSFPFSSSDSE